MRIKGVVALEIDLAERIWAQEDETRLHRAAVGKQERLYRRTAKQQFHHNRLKRSVRPEFALLRAVGEEIR